MEQFEIRRSQRRLKRILRIELRMNKYNPLRGASYITLPKVLANKKAIINVQYNDNKCFLWSILSGLQQADKNSYRVSKYKKCENEFVNTLKGIVFPVKLSDVFKFAKRSNISINVYCFNNGNIAPLDIRKDKGDKHIDLLYITKENRLHS